MKYKILFISLVLACALSACGTTSTPPASSAPSAEEILQNGTVVERKAFIDGTEVTAGYGRIEGDTITFYRLTTLPADDGGTWEFAQEMDISFTLPVSFSGTIQTRGSEARVTEIDCLDNYIFSAHEDTVSATYQECTTGTINAAESP